MKQINKRKAEKFAAKYNSARLPKKKVKVVKLMSCKTCRKAQGVCKYIGKPGHLDQKGKNDYGKQTYSFVAKLMLCPLYADKLPATSLVYSLYEECQYNSFFSTFTKF